MFDVVVIGSANLDLVAQTQRHPLPGETVHGSSFSEFAGGKGLNQAVAAARSGATTAFAGAVGADDAGRRLLQVLADDRIDAQAVDAHTSEPTGRALIVVDAAGENTIVVVAGANGTLAPGHPVPRAKVVIAQLEIPIEAVIGVFRRAKADGATTVLNPAPAMDVPDELLALVDFIIPNQHELSALRGVERALQAGCQAVIVTKGSAGVQVITPDVSFDVAPFTVTPVDTTGAGDAFCGSFAARIAAGDELADGVRWAAAAGALATTKPGAVPGQPYRADIERLMAR